MEATADLTTDAVSFGPFCLAPGERLLTRDGSPVELGGRALDILTALIAKPNEVVRKKELLSCVWPDVTVEESSLRFHMAGLRKALGDGKDGARYITTLAGRGYCFVAPILRKGGRDKVEALAAVNGFPQANLPNRLTRMVGRDEEVLALSSQLMATRFVTVTGAGGVGKTTVAVAVGHYLATSFDGAVLFADLGMLNDPKLVTTTVASLLGLSVQSDDAMPGLISHLREKRVLLVLDTCEHLIDAVAGLVSSIFEAAPDVHILTTSREALHVDGESVYRLSPLAYPSDDALPDAEMVQNFPAVQLFIERAVAGGARLGFSYDEASLIAGICRKLDGVALAIELAARRVGTHGLQQTAELLDQRLTLLWSGSRTAPPRQKTLQATLDWSYELLSELERTVLRRLAVFVGHFTLDAALDVATGPGLDRQAVFRAIDSLVAKSMVATRPIGAMMRYRLLDTTRAYALSIEDEEGPDIAVRHAAYHKRWLEQTESEWPSLQTGTERAPYFAGLNNVRAALDWCFGETGNPKVGVELAAAATPVFLAMSLLTECQRWSEQGLAALDGESRGGREEMQLQASLGLSLLYTRGRVEAVRLALDRSVDIARTLGDLRTEARLLGPLHMYHVRAGDLPISHQHARRCAEIASSLDNASVTALSHALTGVSLHLMGEFEAARIELEAALHLPHGAAGRGSIHSDFDHRNWTDIALPLWLQGYPERALAYAHQAIDDGGRLNHPMSLALVLNAITVLLWAGDLDTAEVQLEWFISRAKSHHFEPYFDLGQALQGELAIRRGEIATGVEIVQRCLERLDAARYGRFNTRFRLVLAQGFVADGRIAEGAALIDETIRQADVRGDITYQPELLRLKGTSLLALPEQCIPDAEKCFEQSLELSRSHGSLAWELRAATDLASLWATQGRLGEARELLSPIYEQFTQGFNTVDLRAADYLLKKLN